MPCDDCSRAESCPPCVSCAHESYEHLGTTTGGGKNLVRRKCEDCGERFTVEVACVREDGCPEHLTGNCRHGCREAADELARESAEFETTAQLARGLPPTEGPEYTPCVTCGHIEPTHDPNGEHCTADPRCDCTAYVPTAEPDECDHACTCEHAAGDHSSSGHCKQCDCEHNIGHYPDDCPEHVCERYFCPASGEAESACHGGFGVCCSAPGKHIPLERCQHGDGLVTECPCTPLCGCCEAQAAPPPQPDRRPPYAVAYSVGGHLYEAYVPGDASVIAMDGALIIEHPGAAVSGIVQVLPVRQEK